MHRTRYIVLASYGRLGAPDSGSEVMPFLSLLAPDNGLQPQKDMVICVCSENKSEGLRLHKSPVDKRCSILYSRCGQKQHHHVHCKQGSIYYRIRQCYNALLYGNASKGTIAVS